jgi:hypothetical protein
MARVHPLSSVRIEPDLFDEALALVAEDAANGVEILLAVISARAYTSWAEVDAPPGVDALEPEEVDTVLALTARLMALVHLRSSGDYEGDVSDPAVREAFVAGVCAATLFEEGGKPRFRLPDLLKHIPKRTR